MKNRIVLSSGNNNKFLELSPNFNKFGYNLITPKDISSEKNLSLLPEVEETGSTYFENALLKAKSCAAWCGEVSLGDDSGLEVEILNGAPGLYSARYGSTDETRINKLLSAIKDKENRNALFRSVLVLYDPKSDKIWQAEGIIKGTIVDTPKGKNGFGYDPIFYVPELNGTLAEQDFQTIIDHGFRCKAVKELLKVLN